MVRVPRLILSASLAVAAAAAALPALAVAESGEGGVYTVEQGDSLSGIASRIDVPLDDLVTTNGLMLTSVIVPGQQLVVPDVAAAEPSAGPANPVETVIAYALAQVGKPYEFFTAGPDTFDCSGLTMAAYERVGIALVHQSASQALQGSVVDHWHEPIRRGDLVFLDSDWDGAIDHVGIALDATTWVQASQSHDAVIASSIPSDSVIVAVRRLVPNS